jgi:hypothetical protein
MPNYKSHRESEYPALKITPLAQEPLLWSPEASRNSSENILTLFLLFQRAHGKFET